MNRPADAAVVAAAPVEYGMGPTREFAGDLDRLVTAIRTQRPFAFARFGDGEWMIIRNLSLDYTQKGNGEFRFSPDDPADDRARQALIESFHYSAPGYLVGIGCPCCWGRDKLLQLRQVCRQPESRLTWANLWGNANYPQVKRGLIPEFRRYRDVYLVCHRNADPGRLPFPVTQCFPVGTNAWTEDLHLGDEIAELAGRRDPGALFLFCAGPLSNILAHRGHRANPLHTYLDLGSTLDPWLFARRQWRWLDWLPGLIRSPGITRGYLKPGRKRRQVCRWWTPTSAELQSTPSDLPADVQTPSTSIRRPHLNVPGMSPAAGELAQRGIRGSIGISHTS
ncbi:MAG: hypothetical protein ACK5Q5_23495 [Planctomycetaceae bacterium]